ncbi:holdfast attachment protein HfaA [Brevundimonas sp. UYEF29]|uniref:holdfast anchoring protein HfaA n=1 Tax=Brevundimonas TaxID=41275 RepID=UPI0005F7A84B|nr:MULTISPECIES: holdfast anchoring protein HfaA [Brevundimonas]KJV41049.1 holdfast attachment protein HfaA [Brevundimonas sp. KM4]MBC1183970.1 holdfast anchoring protein HfaA [Brevundimonas huaxiensis]
MPAKRLFLSTAVMAFAAAASVPAIAQSTGSGGAARFQQGYGGARTAANTAATGYTRDANGNRLIVNGIIQSGASSYSSQSGGAASAYAGAGASSNGGTTIGGSTAIGNQLNVVVQGSRNTVIVNSTQTNTGAINAGTALNGNINLP